ncbi:DExH-box ATP-dependent RNA helicase DExH1 isoform X3 [Momordica charantia]|uniref:RNA helicase n=1 Tax=Momordica charantia TaxID=3673 RepID=A0A6J1DDC1_MOMCH|nr:DExH-box ATP-dependent RNA helicase DExH1 isoform X3 [Momordica charantia]
MSLRIFAASSHSLLSKDPFLAPRLSVLRPFISTFAMSHRPNYQGGRRGGSSGGGRGGARRGGGGGGGGGRGGGGRGEQRWWDPVWRAERLRQKAAEMEVLNENEWWTKMDQMKRGGEQEMIIKRNFSRSDQEILSDMAHQQGLYFHAYNTGKTLVVSKVPLPDYRADLDERHGSTQKEIRMTTEMERRVGNLLDNSHGQGRDHNVSSTASVGASKQLPTSVNSTKPAYKLGTDTAKDKFSAELQQKQEQMKVNLLFFCNDILSLYTCKYRVTYYALQGSDGLKAMLAFREKLPAFKVKSEFLKAMTENQVLVVSGETGCGKTTQLPQFILEEEISKLRGADCRIICTQPRRISAISVAARISAERGENLGETVGYQIRLEAKQSAQTRLLFCTTGVLLRQLVQDPQLTGVSHLLVDEIHERGMNEDFLLIILRNLLTQRPDLRLILMSATINADLFSKYFANAPTLHIPGKTFPVTEFFLEDVLEKTRYNIKSESENFEGNSRRRRRQQESKKDPLSELFEDVDIDTEYKNYSTSTRKSLEAWSGAQLDLTLVESTIEYICRHEGHGAILVFLTGWDDISKLLEKVKANNYLGDPGKFLVLPVHGSMPTINQREIFDSPPPTKRKIVLATNIAESSITIDDVVYVIDCGKAKETSYDALNKLACLLPSWVSKASAHQRRGRAGRVQPGVCYRLYPKIIHDAMLQYQLPEILRTPLQELCLHIKSLQLGTVGSFLAQALQPPDPLAVQNAIELLKTIGALDDMEELTPLGRHLCTLPLDPNIGKMLLMGSIFQCLNPALTIAAALAHRDPFILPINRKEEANDAKKSFAGDSCSDHVALLKAFEGWKDAKRNGGDRSFCWDNFLSPVTLQMMDDMRMQFLDLLSDIGFVNKSRGPSKLRGELDKLLNRKIEEPGFDISTEGKGVVAAAVELLHSQVHH